MAKKVVIPAMNSVLTEVFRSFSLKTVPFLISSFSVIEKLYHTFHKFLQFFANQKEVFCGNKWGAKEPWRDW